MVLSEHHQDGQLDQNHETVWHKGMLVVHCTPVYPDMQLKLPVTLVLQNMDVIVLAVASSPTCNFLA